MIWTEMTDSWLIVYRCGTAEGSVLEPRAIAGSAAVLDLECWHNIEHDIHIQ